MQLHNQKTGEQLGKLRKSGFIAAKAMKKVITSIKAGVTLLELNEMAEKEIYELGGKAAFKSVPGYRWATCLSLNNEIVHGIPRSIKLKKKDLLTIDLGVEFKGWNTDTAWTVIVEGESTPFLQAGEKALWRGIEKARAGNRVGDISNAIQTVLEKEFNYFVSRSLIGHGIGKSLHEEPGIPGFGETGTGDLLYCGMTLAIEAIYTERFARSYTDSDGWTVVSDEGGMAGMFEMSVIVGKKQAEVITDWRKV